VAHNLSSIACASEGRRRSSKLAADLSHRAPVSYRRARAHGRTSQRSRRQPPAARQRRRPATEPQAAPPAAPTPQLPTMAAEEAVPPQNSLFTSKLDWGLVISPAGVGMPISYDPSTEILSNSGTWRNAAPMAKNKSILTLFGDKPMLPGTFYELFVHKRCDTIIGVGKRDPTYQVLDSEAVAEGSDSAHLAAGGTNLCTITTWSGKVTTTDDRGREVSVLKVAPIPDGSRCKVVWTRSLNLEFYVNDELVGSVPLPSDGRTERFPIVTLGGGGQVQIIGSGAEMLSNAEPMPSNALVWFPGWGLGWCDAAGKWQNIHADRAAGISHLAVGDMNGDGKSNALAWFPGWGLGWCDAAGKWQNIHADRAAGISHLAVGDR
jgi:hypothetical protein